MIGPPIARPGRDVQRLLAGEHNDPPAILGAHGEKWDVMTQVREEAFFTKGRVIVRGKIVKRGEGRKAQLMEALKR